MHDQPGEQHAWHDAEARYQQGQQVHGTVTRVTSLGVFLELEPGLVGVIYTFELGTGQSALGGFTAGQELDAYVKSLDVGRKRLELSLRVPSLPDPLTDHALPADLRRKPPGLPLPHLRTGRKVTVLHTGREEASSTFSIEELTSRPTPLEALFSAPAPDQQQKAHACSACQGEIEASWNYCVYCGGSLHRRCPACERVQPDLAGARYCYECGALLA